MLNWMNKFETDFKRIIADAKPPIQHELDAERERVLRSEPWRHIHKGVYAPRTLQEAGL